MRFSASQSLDMCSPSIPFPLQYNLSADKSAAAPLRVMHLAAADSSPLIREAAESRHLSGPSRLLRVECFSLFLPSTIIQGVILLQQIIAGSCAN